MTDEIETRIGLDEKRIYENYKNAQKDARDEQVKMYRREEAWKYVIKEKLAPVLKGEAFVQTYLNLDLSELNIHLLMDQKSEIHNYINLLWCVDFATHLYDEPTPDENGNIPDPWELRKDHIRQVFYPSVKFMLYLERRFGLLGGRVWFRINFDFFPVDNSECKIVDLGMKTISYEKRIIELRCDKEE